MVLTFYLVNWGLDILETNPIFLKIKLLSIHIQMNTLYNNNNERKIRRCDSNIHKAVRIPVNIYQTNKK